MSHFYKQKKRQRPVLGLPDPIPVWKIIQLGPKPHSGKLKNAWMMGWLLGIPITIISLPSVMGHQNYTRIASSSVSGWGGTISTEDYIVRFHFGGPPELRKVGGDQIVKTKH